MTEMLRDRETDCREEIRGLSDEERERLNTLIRAGKHPSRQLTKARILLKADASEPGEGWRDCEIAGALDTGVDTEAGTRQDLVEELRCRACPQAFPSLGQSRASLI